MGTIGVPSQDEGFEALGDAGLSAFELIARGVAQLPLPAGPLPFRCCTGSNHARSNSNPSHLGQSPHIASSVLFSGALFDLSLARRSSIRSSSSC